MIDKIESQLKEAMLSGDKLVVDTLKLIKSALKNKEIELKRPLKDEEIVKTLQSESKKRAEAADLYKKGDKTDLHDKELKEKAVIDEFLPPQLSDEQLEAIVKEVKTELSNEHPGKIIQEVLARTKGQADGKRVAALVMSK